MEYQNMNVLLNKEKAIGKVLFIVEGGRTEPYILHRIFTKIFDYQYETVLRGRGYKKYNSKKNPYSQIFVVNAEESNIRYIDKNNQFLNNLFAELIEHYDFDVDNAAIYYIFDRDNQSNTDAEFIRHMLELLGNARDGVGYERQGMLLLSYPSIESFTVSNFRENCFETFAETGHELKQIMFANNINHQKISEDTLITAAKVLLYALNEITIGIETLELDDFSENNRKIFEFEEEEYARRRAYRLLSLLIISFIDLGLVEIEVVE